MSNIVKTSLLSLTIYSLINLFSIKTQAEIGDPNGSTNQPQTGWTLWQRWDKLTDAKIDFGFSNMDLGAGLELQQLCFGEVDTPNAEKKQQETYWRPLGIVKSGQMIKGEFFPLIIFTTNDNLNWVAIKSPQEGWILTGKTGINENVSLCKN